MKAIISYTANYISRATCIVSLLLILPPYAKNVSFIDNAITLLIPILLSLPLSMMFMVAVRFLSLQRIPRYLPHIILFTIFTSLYIYTNERVFDRLPHITDGFAYLWQAKNIAIGNFFYAPPHPLYEFFATTFIVSDDKMWSIFPLGYPLLLSIGCLLGVPFAVNPILGGISVSLFYEIIREHTIAKECNALVSIIASCMLGLSPFCLVVSSADLSHPMCTALLLVLLLLLFRWNKCKEKRYILGCGIVLGMMFITRPLEGISTVFAVVVFLVDRIVQDKLHFSKHTWICLLLFLGYLPFASMQLAQNRLVTGSFLTFPQTHYFNLTEERQNCFRVVIPSDDTIVGCRREHGIEENDPFTMKDSLMQTWNRNLSLSEWIAKMPLVSLLAIIVLLIPGVIKTFGHTYFIILLMIINVVSYMGYYKDCEAYGPRYLYYSLPLVLILISVGLIRLYSALIDSSRAWMKRCSVLPIIAMIALCSNGIIYAIRDIPQDYPKGFWEVSSSFLHALKTSDIHNAIVLVPGSKVDYRIVSFVNDANIDRTDVIFARDLGDKQNEQLYKYYPQRAFYRLIYRSNTESFYLPLETKMIEGDSNIHIEPEYKWPLMNMYGGWADDPEPYVLSRRLRTNMILKYTMKNEYGGYSFRQYIFKNGIYKLKVRLHVARGIDEILISVNSMFVGDIDRKYIENDLLEPWTSSKHIKLRRGCCIISIIIHKLNHDAMSTGEAGIDWMEFINERG